jgi:polysaccharide export outer membrane protein
MFQTPEDFVFQTPVIDSSNKEYKITANSILSISIFSRSGSAIIEFTTGGSDGGQSNRIPNQNSILQYLVDKNGWIDLPLVGRHNVLGMSIFEAQNFIESKYSSFINDPYCIIRVLNRRVLYFNGNGSAGAIIELEQNTISIFEAIAKGGGIGPRGNSSRVKVIRNMEGKKEVFLFDLSKIDAVQYINFSIQSGDIIYVEPMPQYSAELLSLINPALTLFSTLLIYFSLFAN